MSHHYPSFSEIVQLAEKAGFNFRDSFVAYINVQSQAGTQIVADVFQLFENDQLILSTIIEANDGPQLVSLYSHRAYHLDEQQNYTSELLTTASCNMLFAKWYENVISNTMTG